jgi:UDP-N-acetylmuramoyl-tripeptide--D-alanyl-D-alanine ligase
MKKIFKTMLTWFTRLYLKRNQPYIIWITWSVGKTTSRIIITQMLRDQLPYLRIDTSEKNFNSDIWLCLAILGIQTYEPTFFVTVKTLFNAFFIGLLQHARADVLVLEYWIDHPGDMDELISLVKPHLWILTWVDKVHAAYFPNAEAIFDEKVKLLEATRDVAFYWFPLQSLIENHPIEVDLLSFALHEDQNDTDIGFNAYKLRRDDEKIGSSFIVCEWEDRMTQISTSLLGHEHAWYVSLAYQIAQIVAIRFWQEFQQNKTTSFSVDLQPWRMNWLLGKRWSLLLDSTYNASPWSMLMMIRLLTSIRQELFPERQLIFCLGDMRELWLYSEDEHRLLAEHIMHADCLFLLGSEMKQFLIPELHTLWYAHSRINWFDNSLQLWTAVEKYLSEQQNLALVLCKWSQNTIFLEETVKQLLRYPTDVNKLCRQWDWWMNKKVING